MGWAPYRGARGRRLTQLLKCDYDRISQPETVIRVAGTPSLSGTRPGEPSWNQGTPEAWTVLSFVLVWCSYLTLFHKAHRDVWNAPSVDLIVTVVGPLMLLLAMIDESSPLVSRRRAQ